MGLPEKVSQFLLFGRGRDAKNSTLSLAARPNMEEITALDPLTQIPGPQGRKRRTYLHERQTFRAAPQQISERTWALGEEDNAINFAIDEYGADSTQRGQFFEDFRMTHGGNAQTIIRLNRRFDSYVDWARKNRIVMQEPTAAIVVPSDDTADQFPKAAIEERKMPVRSWEEFVSRGRKRREDNLQAIFAAYSEDLTDLSANLADIKSEADVLLEQVRAKVEQISQRPDSLARSNIAQRSVEKPVPWRAAKGLADSQESKTRSFEDLPPTGRRLVSYAMLGRTMQEQARDGNRPLQSPISPQDFHWEGRPSASFQRRITEVPHRVDSRPAAERKPADWVYVVSLGEKGSVVTFGYHEWVEAMNRLLSGISRQFALQTWNEFCKIAQNGIEQASNVTVTEGPAEFRVQIDPTLVMSIRVNNRIMTYLSLEQRKETV